MSLSNPTSSQESFASLVTQTDTLDLETLLRMATIQGVSDVHFRVDASPILRKDGHIYFTRLPKIREEDMRGIAKKIIPPSLIGRLKDQTDFDFSFQMEGLARFRVNLFYEMGKLGFVLRIIPFRIPAIDELGLPPVVSRFAEMHKGLVLITGPTGSGKSTTLAALLDTINRSMHKHIVTLEDPIEYVYQSDQSVITQRQLGLDTDTFPNGVKYSLRQDPDVILIGEMRDRDTINSALHAAETGHLVLSTLHTVDSVQTINRIINIFEPHERDPVRRQLSGVLQGVVSQRLVRRASGNGRLAVAEVLMVTPAIRDYVLRNEMGEIYQLLAEGAYEGMCNLNHSLLDAFHNGWISAEEALKVSEDPIQLQQMMRGAYHGVSGAGNG